MVHTEAPVKVVKHETACRFAQWREGIGEFGMVLPGFLELRDEAFHVPEFKEAAKLMGERRGQRQHGLRGRQHGQLASGPPQMKTCSPSRRLVTKNSSADSTRTADAVAIAAPVSPKCGISTKQRMRLTAKAVP